MTNVHHIRIHKDHAGQWRWTAIARNGEPVAWGESHTRAADARRAAQAALGHDIRIIEDHSTGSPLLDVIKEAHDEQGTT